MKNIYSIFVLLLSTSFAYSQSISSLSSDLSSLKQQYRSILYSTETVDEFEDEVDDHNRKVSYLLDDIEDAEDELGGSSAYRDLLIETEEFESFTGNNYTCECLSNFNQLIRTLGGSPVLLKEENDVKILKVDLGNFTFYYAYATQNHLYNVTIETASKQGAYSFSSGMSSFGLMNEVEVFKVAPSSEQHSIKSVKVNISSRDGYTPRKCPNDFPRN